MTDRPDRAIAGGHSPDAAALRERIARDLTPVAPLQAPARRTWRLVPIALLLAISAPLLAGGRPDLGDLGGVVAWAISGAQWLLGLWLLTLGLREAVPGERVSARALLLGLTLTILVIVGATLVTFAAHPTPVPPGRALQFWYECVLAPIAFGAPFLVLATLLAGRAFPTRPWLTGALCGAAAGVLTDAGWRLTCAISDPVHVLTSHGLAIALLSAAGAGAATLLDRVRWRAP